MSESPDPAADPFRLWREQWEQLLESWAPGQSPEELARGFRALLEHQAELQRAALERQHKMLERLMEPLRAQADLLHEVAEPMDKLADLFRQAAALLDHQANLFERAAAPIRNQTDLFAALAGVDNAQEGDHSKSSQS